MIISCQSNLPLPTLQIISYISPTCRAKFVQRCIMRLWNFDWWKKKTGTTKENREELNEPTFFLFLWGGHIRKNKIDISRLCCYHLGDNHREWIRWTIFILHKSDKTYDQIVSTTLAYVALYLSTPKRKKNRDCRSVPTQTKTLGLLKISHWCKQDGFR